MATIIGVDALERHRALLGSIATDYFERSPPRHTEVEVKPKLDWIHIAETVTRNIMIRLHILEDMPSIHAVRDYFPRYIVLHDNQVIGDRFYDAKECYYLEPVQKWLDTIVSMERVQAATAIIKEELVAAAWRPERIARLLETGIDVENL